ncbi:EGF-like domain-containing protein [Tieghemostelium lacteum]|uniref:EGF-like domain-containing protein n=1 Tax=Tieghemostelium lacteum TaxID=361077 RepID=A0A151ZFQ6_TIELA|nr:EGF-like domain-containing protein [Tieghemostelium lacteum]|eukprot:KYQ92803.1 EGF-like domain-containing protein [Tieghemostelium lacteum]
MNTDKGCFIVIYAVFRDNLNQILKISNGEKVYDNTLNNEHLWKIVKTINDSIPVNNELSLYLRDQTIDTPSLTIKLDQEFTCQIIPPNSKSIAKVLVKHKYDLLSNSIKAIVQYQSNSPITTFSDIVETKVIETSPPSTTSPPTSPRNANTTPPKSKLLLVVDNQSGSEYVEEIISNLPLSHLMYQPNLYHTELEHPDEISIEAIVNTPMDKLFHISFSSIFFSNVSTSYVTVSAKDIRSQVVPIDIRFPFIDKDMHIDFDNLTMAPRTKEITIIDNQPEDIMIKLHVNRSLDCVFKSNIGSILPIEGLISTGVYAIHSKIYKSTNVSIDSPLFKSDYNTTISYIVKQKTVSSIKIQPFNDVTSKFKNLTSPILKIINYQADINSHLTLFNNIKDLGLQLAFQFPLGFRDGKNGIYKLEYIYLLNSPQQLPIQSYLGYLGPYSDYSPSSDYKDSSSPILHQFNISRLDHNDIYIYIMASDIGSGIREITILNQISLSSFHLIDGDINNGTYEITATFDTLQYKPNRSTPIIKIIDNYNNIKSYFYDDIINTNLQEIPKLLDNIKMNDISSFKFIPNVIDSALKNSNVKLVIKSNVDKNWIPLFGLVYPYKGIDEPDNIYKGYYNEKENQFEIDFVIGKGTFPGKLEYKFQYHSWTGELMEYFFHDDAILTVNSSLKQGDGIGPMIQSVSFTPVGSSTSPIVYSKGGMITITLEITDQFNGFKEGYFNITSSLLPYRNLFSFHLTTADKKSKNDYQISIPMPVYCIPHVYDFMDIELIDQGGNINNYHKYPSELDQVLDLDNPLKYAKKGPVFIPGSLTLPVITLSCPDTTETNLIKNDKLLPILEDFQVTPTILSQLSNRVTVNFTVTDQGSSGVFIDKSPILYFTFANKPPISFNSQILQMVNDTDVIGPKTVKYQVVAEIPFGYGLGGPLLMSLYGILDNNMNMVGYSSEKLMETNFTSIIQFPLLTSPTVTKHDPISVNGGLLVIHGFRLKGTIEAYFISMESGIGFQLSPKNVYSNRLVFTFPAVNNTETILLKLKVNDKYANPLHITFTDYVQKVQPCVNNCSGNGVCTNQGCICVPPWTGPECLSIVHNETTVTLSDNSPEITFTSNPSTNVSLSTVISFLQLREMKFDQTVLKVFNLSLWNLTKFEEDSQVQKSTYTTDFENLGLVTTLNLTISFFKVAKTITFANQDFVMSPNVIKFTLSFSPYRFDNHLSTLQLVMLNQMKSLIVQDQCSSSQVGYTNADSSDTSWIEIGINDYSLYGKFLKYGLIDDRLTHIRQSIISQEDLGDQSTISIGLSIPHFKFKAIIDPDFSILFKFKSDDPKPSNSKNTVCRKSGIIYGNPNGNPTGTPNISGGVDGNVSTSNNLIVNGQSNSQNGKKKLSKALLIAIIVSSIACSVIATILIIFTIKYKWWIKYKAFKIMGK